MSKLSDALRFDVFNVKDNIKKIKQDPERLLYGMHTVDPLSTKMTNWLTGSNYEPLTDLSGGPYGGHTSALFSKTDGGVYQRARDAGLNTSSREQVHDAASVAGLLSGAAYGGSQALGGGSNAVGGAQSASPSGWFSGFGGGDSGAVGGAESASGGGLLNGGGGNFMQQGMGLLGQGQPQQQAQPMMQPVPQQDESARLRMMQQLQLQALRQKPNKTLEEWAQLASGVQNQGLLGYG